MKVLIYILNCKTFHRNKNCSDADSKFDNKLHEHHSEKERSESFFTWQEKVDVSKKKTKKRNE